MNMRFLAIPAFVMLIIILVSLVLPSHGLITDTTTVSLNKGWNLVSAPYSDFTIVKSESSYDANSKPVDAGSYDTNSKDSQTESSYDTCSIKAIYHYNAESGKWDDKFTELEKMKPGLGYWIYANSECSAIFSGTVGIGINDLGENNDGLLIKGWNQIGGIIGKENLFERAGDCDIKAIYNYDSQQGKYTQSGAIVAGKAYWVYVSGNSYFSLQDSQNSYPLSEDSQNNQQTGYYKCGLDRNKIDLAKACVDYADVSQGASVIYTSSMHGCTDNANHLTNGKSGGCEPDNFLFADGDNNQKVKIDLGQAREMRQLYLQQAAAGSDRIVWSRLKARTSVDDKDYITWENIEYPDKIKDRVLLERDYPIAARYIEVDYGTYGPGIPYVPKPGSRIYDIDAFAGACKAKDEIASEDIFASAMPVVEMLYKDKSEARSGIAMISPDKPDGGTEWAYDISSVYQSTERIKFSDIVFGDFLKDYQIVIIPENIENIPAQFLLDLANADVTVVLYDDATDMLKRGDGLNPDIAASGKYITMKDALQGKTNSKDSQAESSYAIIGYIINANIPKTDKRIDMKELIDIIMDENAKSEYYGVVNIAPKKQDGTALEKGILIIDDLNFGIIEFPAAKNLAKGMHNIFVYTEDGLQALDKYIEITEPASTTETIITGQATDFIDIDYSDALDYTTIGNSINEYEIITPTARFVNNAWLAVGNIYKISAPSGFTACTVSANCASCSLGFVANDMTEAENRELTKPDNPNICSSFASIATSYDHVDSDSVVIKPGSTISLFAGKCGQTADKVTVRVECNNIERMCSAASN
ncbi:MAG: hypothetical protein HZB65_04495 [Candidatus Aenigmarchaeota archaeon]|nr:hypothetical protein [Candidatus Aenigmarchaeota archaeon]